MRRSCARLMDGLIEMRTYETAPRFTAEYLKLAEKSAPTRARYFGDRWKLFLQAETGYGSLGDLIHLYHHHDLASRAEVRADMGKDKEWVQFLVDSRPCLVQQRSELFVPIKLRGKGLDDIKYFDASCINSSSSSSSSISNSSLQLKSSSNTSTSVYEIRHYQLLAGYDMVPRMTSIFQEGLPDKLAACDNAHGQLVLLAASECGMLNQFIEVWRYSSSSASLAHREASRKALVWRQFIARAAEITVSFKNRLMLPTRFSPLQ